MDIPLGTSDKREQSHSLCIADVGDVSCDVKILWGARYCPEHMALRELVNSRGNESDLDNIMEDLITGHNFEHARTVILEWHAAAQERAVAEAERQGRIDELERAERQKIYQGAYSTPRYAIPAAYISDRLHYITQNPPLHRIEARDERRA